MSWPNEMIVEFAERHDGIVYPKTSCLEWPDRHKTDQFHFFQSPSADFAPLAPNSIPGRVSNAAKEPTKANKEEQSKRRCGNTLTHNSSREVLSIMANDQFASVKTVHVLEHYKNHCEFLGYITEETDEFSIYFRHARRNSLKLILLNGNAGVMAQLVYGTPKHLQKDLATLYMYANDLNCMFYFMKACIRTFDDYPPALILTSVFEGDYNRQSFSVFLENIHDDVDTFRKHPKTVDLWRNPDESVAS